MTLPIWRPTLRERLATWWKRGVKRWTMPEIMIAVGMLIVTAFQLVVLCQQTRILTQEHDDAANRDAQTQAITEAQKSIATASQGSADSMYRSADYSRRALEDNRHALEKTIEMWRIEQRPWIGPLRIDGPQGSKEAPVFSIDVSWLNSGKTPARKFRALVGMENKAAKTHYTPNFAAGSTVSASLFLPNTTLHSLLTHPLTDQETRAIVASRTQKMYAFGRATYQDTFAKPHSHWSTFFYVYEPTTGTWTIMGTHNDTDAD